VTTPFEALIERQEVNRMNALQVIIAIFQILAQIPWAEIVSILQQLFSKPQFAPSPEPAAVREVNIAYLKTLPVFARVEDATVRLVYEIGQAVYQQTNGNMSKVSNWIEAIEMYLDNLGAFEPKARDMWVTYDPMSMYQDLGALTRKT